MEHKPAVNQLLTPRGRKYYACCLCGWETRNYVKRDTAAKQANQHESLEKFKAVPVATRTP